MEQDPDHANRNTNLRGHEEDPPKLRKGFWLTVWPRAGQSGSRVECLKGVLGQPLGISCSTGRSARAFPGAEATSNTGMISPSK